MMQTNYKNGWQKQKEHKEINQKQQQNMFATNKLWKNVCNQQVLKHKQNEALSKITVLLYNKSFAKWG